MKKYFDQFVGKKMLRDASFLIAETQVGVQEYLDVDPTLDKDRLVIVSPPFDTDEFASLPKKGQFRSKFNISNDCQLIMFLGRIHHIKGIDFLIKGFSEYLKRAPQSKLVIVGSDDGFQSECEALVGKLGIKDSVIFTGFLDGSFKKQALVDADVVCQTSRHEQGAWAPIEAVLCHTPIIVTSHTGAGEDVRRLKAGYCVDFDNDQQLADRIEFILTKNEEAKQLTSKARDYIIENMSMNARSNEYTDLYYKAMENQK